MLNDKSISDPSKKIIIPTTIISSPTSTFVCVNTEISNDYQNCIYEPSYTKKKKIYFAHSLNFDQKIETSHFKPQTEKLNNRYKQFVLKKNTPKTNLTSIINEKFKNEPRKIIGMKENFIDDYINNIKNIVFCLKNDEIINNLKFFEKLKNSFKLNFYSAFEDCDKTPKYHDKKQKNSELYNLILITLMNLERKVFLFIKKVVDYFNFKKVYANIIEK